jgi:hypothetical protein
MGVNEPYDPYGLAPVPPPLGDRGDVPSTRRRRRDLFDDESSHHADLEDKAALVQEQLASLRDLVRRATSSDADIERSHRQRVSLETKWWNVKEENDLISYQDADAYIKRAGVRLAGHRKWYPTPSKSADKNCTDALEELRLASLVLQQRQGEEIEAAKALSSASEALTERVNAEKAATTRLRADLEPLAAAVADAMEDVKRALTREAARKKREAEHDKTKTGGVEPSPSLALAAANAANADAANDDGAFDRAAYEEVHRAREETRAARAGIERAHSQARTEQLRLLEEIEELKDERAKANASAAAAAAEANKFRALYEATRDHAGRSDHARVEADALRAAVAHAEDRHRRELMLLGTEHGNAYASARRSLAAAERKIGDLESSVEEAETRLKSREDQYREERAKRLGLDEELATLRHDLLTRDKDSVAAAMKDEELQRALKATEEAKREAARLAEELDLAAGDFGAADERGRRLSEQLDATRRELIDARSEAAAAGVASGELPGKVQRLEAEVRRRVRLCDRLFLTRRSVSTLDRVSFQLTDERTLFVLLARPSGS